MADAFPPWKIFRTRIEQLRDFKMVSSFLISEAESAQDWQLYSKRLQAQASKNFIRIDINIPLYV